MKVITIGRNPGNNVAINDPSVGEYHCQIIQDDYGNFTLIDLNSANGTFVNDQQRQGQTRLNPSDVVRVGNMILPWTSYFSNSYGQPYTSPDRGEYSSPPMPPQVESPTLLVKSRGILLLIGLLIAIALGNTIPRWGDAGQDALKGTAIGMWFGPVDAGIGAVAGAAFSLFKDRSSEKWATSTMEAGKSIRGSSVQKPIEKRKYASTALDAIIGERRFAKAFDWIGGIFKGKQFTGQSMTAKQTEPTTKKNNLVTVRLRAVVNNNSNGRICSINCNYGNSDYQLWKGGNIFGMFSSGIITVPTGKSWIYKDAKIIKGADTHYNSSVAIIKNNSVIQLGARDFTGLTLHEGNKFRVLCDAVAYNRNIAEGNTIGVEFTFIELDYSSSQLHYSMPY
jgi:hypothetical protein